MPRDILESATIPQISSVKQIETENMREAMSFIHLNWYSSSSRICNTSSHESSKI